MTDKLNPKISKKKAFLFKAILIGTPVIAVCAMEVFFSLRFAAEYPDTTLAVQGAYRFTSSHYRDYSNNPGYVRRMDGIVYRYNNYGFRDEEDIVAEKPENTFRVFVMGGSMAYGERASEHGQYQLISGQKTYPSDQAISGHLERNLQDVLPDRKVEVWNSSVVSYHLHHNYLTYLETLRSLDPDLLVSIDGQNELFGLDNPYLGINSGAAVLGGGALVKWLRSHSYTLFYLGIAVRRSAAFDRANDRNIVELDDAAFDAISIEKVRAHFASQTADSQVRESVIDGLLNVYEGFQLATKLDNVPTLFAIQPVLSLDVSKPLTDKEEKLLKYLRYKDYKMYGVAKLADRLRARADSDDSFHMLDMLGIFADFPGEAYTDYCHLTPEANAHVAQKITDYLMANAMIPASTTAPAADLTRPPE